MKINIAGLGPGGMENLSLGAYEILMSKGIPLYLRTQKHPNIPMLETLGMRAVYLDEYYEQGASFEEVYENIAAFIIKQAQQYDEITYAVPGHPCIAEKTVELIQKKAKELRIEICLLPSMSFIDATFAAVGRDPSDGFALVNALSMDEEHLETKNHLLITQVYDAFVASDLKIRLLEVYAAEKELLLVKNAGMMTEQNAQQVRKVTLEEMDRIGFAYDHLTSVFVPACEEHERKNLQDLIAIVRKLRSDSGCPWDRKQTHLSLKDNIVEEAVEVKEAIESEDIDNLIEELGDVLLQIVFHSELGRESAYFNLLDVTDGICNKLIYRHPHVFAGLEIDESELADLWQRLKQEEKKRKNAEK